jgi:hypothetical protein
MADNNADDGTRFGFLLPDYFHELPGLDDQEALAARLAEVVAVVGADDAQQERDGLLEAYTNAFGALAAQGAVYAGFGMIRGKSGELSVCSLNVFLTEHPEANPHLVTAQVLEAHADGGSAHAPGMSATAVELPCGPAVFVIRLVIAPEDMDPAAPAAAWQAQAVIPFPKGRQVAVLDLSTPCTTEAPHYAGILDGIAHTVRFSSPEAEAGSDRDSDSAAGSPQLFPEQHPSDTSATEPRSRITDVLG